MASSLTKAQARAFARKLARDVSTPNPGITDATYDDLISEARSLFAATYPDQFTGLLSFGAVPTTTAHSYLKTFTPTDIVRDITGIQVSPGTTYNQMERAASLSDILNLIDAVTTEGVPTKYFVTKTLNSDTSYDVYFTTTPDAAYNLRFYGIVEPAEFVSDSSLVLFGMSGSRTIARMAAVQASILLGRPPEYVNAIAQPLPDAIRARMLEEVRAKGVRVTGAHIG